MPTRGDLEAKEFPTIQEMQVRNSQSFSHNHPLMPRLEIPKFEGRRPMWWVRRCDRFFQFYKVSDEQKVNLVATYLNDTALLVSGVDLR